MTPLLSGQAVKLALCSTSVTARRGASPFSARAQVAPAKPPPITTTRPAEPCASAGRNNGGAQPASAARLRKSRRVLRPPVISGAAQSFCSAYHAAMAALSGSEKPLAMRSITVVGRCPARKACIAVTISTAGRPARRGTGVCTAALAAWHPEQELAPGGASAAAALAGPASDTSKANPAIACRNTVPAFTRRGAPPDPSGGLQIVIHQRQRSTPLAGRREDRVEHRRGGDADRRLADATPEIARGHDDDLDLGHLVYAHHVVAVEIGLLDRAAIDRAFAVQGRREAIDER